MTAINPSIVGAAGEIISTTADLTHFFDALLTGRLTSPTSLHAMRTTVPTSNPRLRFGLGLTETVLPCGTSIWGHDGGALGFQTTTARTDDGRQLVLSANPYIDLLPTGPVDAIRELVFCRT